MHHISEVEVYINIITNAYSFLVGNCTAGNQYINFESHKKKGPWGPLFFNLWYRNR